MLEIPDDIFGEAVVCIDTNINKEKHDAIYCLNPFVIQVFGKDATDFEYHGVDLSHGKWHGCENSLVYTVMHEDLKSAFEHFETCTKRFEKLIFHVINKTFDQLIDQDELYDKGKYNAFLKHLGASEYDDEEDDIDYSLQRKLEYLKKYYNTLETEYDQKEREEDKWPICDKLCAVEIDIAIFTELLRVENQPITVDTSTYGFVSFV